ncbi:MAG TPA: universal stress protein [Sandaracinaceae bacterium LLY-WYZ-13_1]|nr:universal stress protein [Sandaracinaceae bacterium LLY-WYZ-13_1]
MPITQSILVATDFSPSARHGLEKAAELARDVGAKITVCHVLDPSPLAPIATRGATGEQFDMEQDVEKAIHEALTEVVKEHFDDIEHTKTALIISPNAADGICHYAQKEDTDLIVISTHGRTGLAHLLIGSVAEKVVRHAPCPVLTVRSPVGVED